MKTIDVESAPNPRGAVINARIRGAAARDAHKHFFNDPAHQQKVDQVIEIVDSFFKVKKGMYVNPRDNRGQPFTAVKVDNPLFPAMKSAQVDSLFRKPLADLGVETLFSCRTNSYIFRVR